MSPADLIVPPQPVPPVDRMSPPVDARPLDAIRQLKHDHRVVKAWFNDYEALEDNASKQRLADEICIALAIHMQIEEEIFYPALRAVTGASAMLDEAQVEHDCVRQLIAGIQAIQAGEPLFDAKIKVLGEYIIHHADEEEAEMFPESRDCKLDMPVLGAAMAERRAELAFLADAKPRAG